MLHYLLLSFSTLIIAYLTFLIWKRTRQVAFLLGIAFIYYWTLLGAWFIIFDDLSGQKGKEIGLHYYHLYERLFPVHVDSTYLYAIGLYSLFIITIQSTILFFLRNKYSENKINNKSEPFSLNHTAIIICCTLTALVSCILVWKEILTAAKFEQSVYVVTRHQPGNFFTLHQLLNQVSIVTLFIGLISFFSGKESRYITGDNKKSSLYFYIFAVIFIEGYLLFIGNKREILFAGILGLLLYMSNAIGKVNYKPLFFFLIIIFIPLIFNDGVRSYSPTFLTKYFDVSELEYHPDMEIVYTQFSIKNTSLSFLFSNEIFASHFSMYGILSHHVPPTYGTSLISLAASLVPRIVWPDRPPAIYNYYVQEVGAMPGQGYTIHHASAWYLNFGLIGVLGGAVLFGWLWVTMYKKHISVHQYTNKFLKLFFTLGFACVTSQIPSLIRSGPEGYKALFFEALIIPVVMLYFSSKVGSGRPSISKDNL